MRARRREINIFNMSLLDILCGALGAFCFMMLVALPYYKPPGSAKQLREAQAETQKLLKDLENLQSQMLNKESVDELKELLKRLEAQIKVLQGQVNILSAEKEELERRMTQIVAENEQLKAQANQLAAENDLLKRAVAQEHAEKKQLEAQVNQLSAKNKELWEGIQQLTTDNTNLAETNRGLTRKLRQRQPFVVIARAQQSQEIHVLVTDKIAAEKPGPDPQFDAWLNGDLERYNPLRGVLLSSSGMAIGMTIEIPAGTHFKIFLRLSKEVEARQNTVVESALFEGASAGGPVTRESGRGARMLPRVTLTPERFWTLLGTVTINDNYAAIFKEATAAEREAEWQAVSKNTPSATEAPGANREDVSEKLRRLMRMPPDDSGATDAEALRLSDELLKELPPNDISRSLVEKHRDAVLENKARREGTSKPHSPSASPTP